MALTLAILAPGTPVLGRESRPNVILILADDLGYGDLGCYGSTRQRTPVLDELAESGLRLTNFHAGATVCTPSRMALLTGVYPVRLGWRGGVLGYRMKTSTGLSPSAVTLAEDFRGAGYRTALVGKWHLGSTPDLHPMAQGFDEAFHIKMSNNQTKKLWRDDTLIEELFDNRRLTEQFTREAIDFIRSEDKRPFFLFLSYTAPHFPAEPHPDWKEKSGNGAYGDVVEELDARIGEILAVLKTEGPSEDTIVVFLSDNGPEPGQKRFATAAPYRGLKWSALEGGTRVPCLVSWPGKIRAGRVSDALLATVDLRPTLAAACELEPIEEALPTSDGVNAWPLFSGQAPDEPPRKDLLYWNGWGTLHAIRQGDWKLYLDSIDEVAGSDTGPVLFDLSSDPGEKVDLASKHPERVATLTQLARQRLTELEEGAIPLGGKTAVDPFPDLPRWLRP